jgi:glycolate oxidase
MAADFATLHQMVQLARRNLARGEWDYLAGAAETETTMKRNRLALDRLALRARVMNDVSQTHVSRTVLGVDLRIPVMLAPIGSLQVCDPGGGLAAARAAGEFGVMQILSSVCQPDFESLARDCDAPKIYQLYLHGPDEAWMMGVIERAVAAGYKAFCLTADTQVGSRRERDILKGYLPLTARQPGTNLPRKPGPTMQPLMSWAMVARIRERFDIPIAIKGIACGEDAELAVKHGVQMVYVSNHGGRQLDQGEGTMDVLPEVVDAVAGRATVLVDGGIMRGTDVLKALALGADAVAIGRLEALAMAAGGTPGVVRMLELLETEMRLNLALMGLSSIDQLTPRSVVPAQPVVPPHVLSAFPLLEEDY